MVEKGYIDRELAFDMITDLAGMATTKAAYAAIWKSAKQLNKVPTADVAPVKHGHWIKTANTWTHDYNEKSKPIYYCSLCGRYEKLKEPYCNCGAKMDGE